MNDNITKIIENHLTLETEKSFSQSIENRVWDKDISYMDAIVELMEEKNIDSSQVSKLISKEIKNILQHEAESLSLIKK